MSSRWSSGSGEGGDGAGAGESGAIVREQEQEELRARAWRRREMVGGGEAADRGRVPEGAVRKGVQQWSCVALCGRRKLLLHWSVSVQSAAVREQQQSWLRCGRWVVPWRGVGWCVVCGVWCARDGSHSPWPLICVPAP